LWTTNIEPKESVL